MSRSVSEVLRLFGLEATWLVGSYGAAYLVARHLMGVPVLDIQMHNTYFVLNVTAGAILLFSVLAPVVTALRVAIGRKTAYTIPVLAGLTTLLLLLVAWVALLLSRAH